MRDYDTDHDTMTRNRDSRSWRNDDRGGFFGTDRGTDSYSERPRETGWFSDRNRDEDRDYGPDQYRTGIPRDETQRLIASNKVEGTPVYGRDGDKLGSIYNFMVEKRRGQVEFAVMKTSSGFLGLDERYYPLNWDELTYDTRLGGYHINMNEEDLKRRRSFDSKGRSSHGSDRDFNENRPYRSGYGRFERPVW